MALSPGTRLGSLEIGPLIGAGGMGEVYRATDLQLKRDVAVKVLPGALAEDDKRLARFKREAELLAALNHPNVAQIYGLERASGVTAIVMELIEGATLADRLALGAIPADEALEIALQLIDALEAAHERGIVHRDLKPANVSVRADGRVKVLDFGIAKVFDEAAHGTAPNATTRVTRPGFAVGTTAYMSPEQARGKPVDQRTDIWAFGCILYEMLTGRPAFAGEDDTSTLARVLERDTDMSTLPGAIPAAVRKTLQLCLVKDQRERVADIRDVRLVLKGTFEEAPARQRVAWRWIAAVVAAAAIAGFLVWSVKSTGPSGANVTAAAPVIRARIDVAEGQHLSTAFPIDDGLGLQRPSGATMALSPDGTRLAYTAGDGKVTRLYVRRLDQSQATVIPGTDGASLPFFSPDGASIGFFVGDEIKRVAADGGEVRTIAASQPDLPLFAARRAVWIDGDRLLVTTQHGIAELPATGGPLTLLTELRADEFAHLHPQMLPSRRGLLYSVLTQNTRWVPSDWTIAVQPLDGGERRVLIRGGSDPKYLPTGHLIFARKGALLAAPFDAESLELKGAPTVVLENVMHAEGGGNGGMNTGTAQFTVSRTGSLAYLPGGIYPETGLTRPVWVDLAGKATELDLPTAAYLFPRISPDGKRLSYAVGRFGDTQIWVYDLALGVPTSLTKGGQHQGVNWSPDGTRIAFFRPDLDNRMFTLPIDGSTEPQPIGDGVPGYPTSWSRDNVLAYLSVQADAPGIWTLKLDGASKPELFVAGPVGWPTFSPDGKWLAYTGAEAGRAEVYVRPYPGRTPVYRISAAGGSAPAWSPDGKRLFFLNPSSLSNINMMVVDVTTAPGFAPGRPRALLSGGYGMTGPERGFDIAPDGQRFIMLARAPDPPNEPVTSIQLVLSWFEELNKLVPVPKR